MGGLERGPTGLAPTTTLVHYDLPGCAQAFVTGTPESDL